MKQPDSLKKTERLKSRKRIEELFRKGKRFSVFPFKVIYLSTPVKSGAGVDNPPMPIGPDATLQVGFGASSRLFRKAVDRNRIKRLSREAWRLQKHPLSDHLRQKGLTMAVFIIYTGKQLPEYTVVTRKIAVALQKLIQETA